MKEKTEIRLQELKRTGRIVINSPLGIIGVVIITIVILNLVLAPFLVPYNPIKTDIANRMKPPSQAHWFGTDSVGRDVLSRVLTGSTYSLAAAAGVVLISVSLGSLVGLIAGYPGKRFGEYLMRITDIFLAFPTLILAIALASTLGPSFVNAIIAISIIYWPKYARLVFSQALSLKEQDFVKTAEVLHESAWRIRKRHILPNCVSVLLVQATFDFGDTILFCAALSFLGLGAQPPAPDWGAMIAFAQDNMMIAWWMAVFPGLAIFFTVMGFNLLGDSLRDALDPRLRHSLAMVRIRLLPRVAKRRGQ
jgi:peptide/nickel transport system permease protein